MWTVDLIGNIKGTRGTDGPIAFTVTDSAGVAQDVSAATFKLTVRSTYDNSVILQLASPLANGIDMSSSSTGVVVATFPRAVTATMGGPYVYDLQMTKAGVISIPEQGSLTIRKDVTGTASAPIIIPPLQFLAYVSLGFERQLQDGDILISGLHLARTGNSATIRYVHVDADIGPTGASATFTIQDDLSAPTQTVNCIVPDSSGAAVHRDFDADASPATLTPFALTNLAGRGLTVKCATASAIELGRITLGHTYA